jgi:hypothetical protein
MPQKAIRAQARALENEFFAKRDAEKLAALRKALAERVERQGLAQVTGIPDEAVLGQLMAVGITADTLAALALVPLVLVAWADGTLDDKERRAVLAAAASRDLDADGPAHRILTSWLDERPAPSLRAAWHEYAAAFREHLPPHVVATIRAWVMDRAREVAAATGGFLGLGSKISSAEQAVLDELEAAFNPK